SGTSRAGAAMRGESGYWWDGGRGRRPADWRRIRDPERGAGRREAADDVHHGLQPIPHRHSPLAGLLPPGAPATGRDGEVAPATGRYKRSVPVDASGGGGSQCAGFRPVNFGGGRRDRPQRLRVDTQRRVESASISLTDPWHIRGSGVAEGLITVIAG